MKKIVIVEDHADIRRLIRMTLEFEDCEIHEAANVSDGWRLVQQVRPDLVLLDVMVLGEGTGLDLCLAIKLDAGLAGVPVILLSARGSSADREAGLRAGADAYLVKPFSPMELLHLVNTREALA